MSYLCAPNRKLLTRQRFVNIEELLTLYARHPKVKALSKVITDDDIKQVYIAGLQASSAPLVFAACQQHGLAAVPLLFILDDQEEAGYFYHDLVQLLGEQKVLFFPSSFRRAVKFGQRDAANEILRTEVLARTLSPHSRDGERATSPDSSAPAATPPSEERAAAQLMVVTYPEALAELVVSKKALDDRTLQLRVGERVDISFVEQTLFEFGFQRTDYVYEPGQFAVRGSLVDVFSFSSEYPYRIDFFGDEVDSIRTFEVESQLSRGQQEFISLVPDLSNELEERVPLATLLPKDLVVVAKDLAVVAQRIGQIWDEGFSQQALIEERSRETDSQTAPDSPPALPREGANTFALRRDSLLIDAPTFEHGFAEFKRIELSASPTHTAPSLTGRAGGESAGSFSITPQPIFHKNFDLVTSTFEDYLSKGYKLFILADSAKQTDRLAAIFNGQSDSPQSGSITFTPVSKTLHAGFADNDLKVCLFTDHQIFDRFHKFSLKSERARSGKVALSIKELQEFNIGDYVVHVDHGIGRFGGLVRVPANGSTASGTPQLQEMIKITYDHNDVVYVSIHSLHKVSKYKGKDGEPPRISRLGTGAWERMKERTKAKIKDIARDLINLYSRRREEKGFKFSPDSYLQHELEASFLYEDTPDQLKATNDVKADMERASRHGACAPHGPPRMRRRRFRQNRSGRSRRVQGSRRWQAGGSHGSHHRARLSALPHVLGTPERPARARRLSHSRPHAQTDKRASRRLGSRQNRHSRRHA